MFVILNGCPLALAEFVSSRTNMGLRAALPSKLNQKPLTLQGLPHQRRQGKELLRMPRMVQRRSAERLNPHRALKRCSHHHPVS
jgi:hypothetical protein